jgi:predicted HicB family RNase H-like nuclease
MAKRTTYRPGPDIPKGQKIRDRKGRVINDAYVEHAVEDAIKKARTRGRPSLSEAGESPLLRVRIPQDLDDAVRRAAAKSGTSRAEWVRQVLDKASRKAG